MKKLTLEQLIEREKTQRCEGGAFGIAECKDSIRWTLAHTTRTLYSLLEDYVQRANEDPFVNKAMVLACWELINEQ